jgi:hypothetical protein
MKLGIFGDSYATQVDYHVGDSWVKLLSSNFDTTVYAKQGASGYWIYQQFLDNYKKYDKIIYVVTYPLRLSTSFTTVSSVQYLDYVIEKNKKMFNLWGETQQIVIRAIRDYLKFAMTDTEIEKQHVLWHNLMIDKVKQSGKDILFIPAFSYPNTDFEKIIVLHDITRMENNVWGADWVNYKELYNQWSDNRQCHLTVENNKILHRIVFDKIESLSGIEIFKIPLSQFSIPDSLETYKIKHEQ